MADTMRRATDAEIAYFAGFFDGEGTIGIYRKKYVVGLANTDVRPLALAKEIWGGSVYKAERALVQDLFHWMLYGRNSRIFLDDIRPLSIVKANQIDLYLGILKIVPYRRGERRQPGVTALVDDAILKLKLMKRGA